MERWTLYWLWIALGLFFLRVLGQVMVGIYAPAWLPPMPQWYSGLLPYPLLLPSQLLLLMLMAVVSYDNSRGEGYFAVRRESVRRWLAALALLYMAAMLARYGISMWLHPERRWLGGTIPIVFHCVLASYLWALARVGTAGEVSVRRENK